MFFDFDAVRLYLPLSNVGSFVATIDDNYWGVGKKGDNINWEYFAKSSSNTCTYSLSSSTSCSRLYFYANNRSIDLEHSCMTDGIAQNCDDVGLIGLDYFTDPLLDFNVNDKYNNLYQPTVGNVNLAFTYP